VAALAAALAPVPSALAAPVRGSAPHVQRDRVVAGHTVGARSMSAPAVRPFTAPAPSWPAATTADADLVSAAAPFVGAAAPAGPAMPVGTVVGPVRVAPAGAAGARVRVQVLDRATTAAAGVRGLLVRLGRVDGVSGAPVGVTIDYNAFRTAYGGGWADRLRLVQMPACAVTTPGAAGCAATPLATRNDTGAGTLSATVDVAPQTTGGLLVAAQAGPSGGSGSFAATTLQPSGSWSVGGSTGDFQWSYPLQTPPGAGGPAPQLSLTYDSASVDGEMATTNNQPSWVGEGFELSSGYVERSYRACSDDMGGSANNTTPTGDECWVSNNATLSLGGHSGELIQDGGNPNRWHLRSDDGTFVDHLTGAGNGAQNGEYWRVTTPNGSQFFFGSTPSANSTLTEPVYGNNPGEPCHQSSFASSSCTQAYRWNLDRAVDPSGNTITYHFAVEANEYAANDDPNNPAGYDRASQLTEIDYGITTTSTGSAPVRVLFNSGSRCVTSSCGTHDATNWPDTPWDQQCTGSPCANGSPTFWSTVMLNSITTQLYSGTGTTYTNVTSWTLTHTFPDPGDGTRAGLWLSSIQETGSVGGTSATLPPVTFTPVQMQNRVDPVSLGLPPMNWMRIAQITSETGAQTQVSYSPIDCIPGSRTPNTSDLPDNPFRCYPVIWTPPGFTAPITDFFNKYVVTQVNVADLTTPADPTTTTAYSYQGPPAWHFTDDAGITPASKKTWSVWRGYGDVKVTTGTGAGATTTETLYFRGMNGDHLPSGTRSVTLPAVDMNDDGNTNDSVDAPAAADDEPLDGMTRERITWTGTSLVSATVNGPYESAPTATRTLDGVTVNAAMTGIADTHSEAVLDNGRAPRTTSTHTDFDAFGMPVAQTNNGDDAVAGDESCRLTTYNRSTSSDGSVWILDLASRVQEFATTCVPAQTGNLTADQVVSDTLTYYDGATSVTTPPTRGMVTRTDEMKDWVAGAPVYSTAAQSQFDARGRITSATDIRGNTTTTSYTTNAGGQQVTASQTNLLGWVTSNTVDPATGEVVQSTDQNGRITAEAYDPFGRLNAVWQPGRDRATQSANVTYSYLVRNNAPTVVTTGKLTANGGYLTTYALYDGLLRARQTQAARGDGQAGALVTDTFYDTAGRANLTNSAYLASVNPGTNLFLANQQSDVPQYTTTTFDGAGRPTASTMYINAAGTPRVFATTTTAYGGDRVDVTPPAGSTATSTVTDARGNTEALLQYHGTSPTPFTPGSYDETTYTYNAKNRLVRVTDPAGNPWTTTYNARGRIVQTSDPDNGIVDTTYDDFGDVTSTTDARGLTLDYTYDQLARKTGVYQGSVSPANLLASWTYDGLSNSRGQVTSTTSYDGGSAYTISILGFTASYQPTATSYTIPAVETGLAGTYTYTSTYAQDGSPATSRIPTLDGGALPTETLTQSYTALGQPSSLSTSLPTATTLVPSIQYTGYGELGVMSLQTNGGSAAYLADTYTAGTRTLAEELVSRQTSPTTVADNHYTYDPSGNPTEITDTVSSDSQCFQYDYLDRLVSAWTPAGGDCTAAKSVSALGGPGPYWTDWTYNVNGTRTGKTRHDTPNGPQTSAYTVPAPQAAQPHTTTASSTTDSTGTHRAVYSYDQVGNTTSRPSPNGPANQTLTWNAQGHVATVTDNGQTTSYTYDVNGTRLIERDATGKTLYLPGQQLRYTTASAAKATTRYYTEAGHTIAMRATSGVTWLFGDAQGSVDITIDAATQNASIRRQDPFGSPRGSTTGTRPPALDKGFAGGTNDATGLVHLGAREYDPALGRFASVDPVLDKSIPQRYDGYAYCSDNPVRSSDPAGTDPPSGPPPGAPDGPGWHYVFAETDLYWFDADGFRVFYTLDWYLWCTGSGASVTCIGPDDGNPNTFWEFSDGIPDNIFVIRLAPPPPPPVTCTNQPVFYVGPADPSTTQQLPQLQASQNCPPGALSCLLNNLEGAASDALCGFLPALCQTAAAAMDPAGAAYNLISGRDAGDQSQLPDLIGIGVGLLGGGEDEAAASVAPTYNRDVALGLQSDGFRDWADNPWGNFREGSSYTHFTTEGYGTTPRGVAYENTIWGRAATKAINDPSTRLHISLVGMAGGAYEARLFGAMGLGAVSEGASNWEMFQVQRAILAGNRSWDSIVFYAGAYGGYNTVYPVSVIPWF
jgi:RHS repeat-associated protein